MHRVMLLYRQCFECRFDRLSLCEKLKCYEEVSCKTCSNILEIKKTGCSVTDTLSHGGSHEANETTRIVYRFDG